jgi:hypothetical protein
VSCLSWARPGDADSTAGWTALASGPQGREDVKCARSGDAHLASSFADFHPGIRTDPSVARAHPPNLL